VLLTIKLKAEIIPGKPDTDNTGVGMHWLLIMRTAFGLFIHISLVSVPVFTVGRSKAFFIFNDVNKWSFKKTILA
jgi:hypothetical protein